MGYVLIKKGKKEKYKLFSIENMIEKWILQENDKQEDTVERNISQSDLLFFIRCYEKQAIIDYMEILTSVDFKAISREYFINKILKWIDCYDHAILYNDKMVLPESLTRYIEVEYSNLISLYNNIDWKIDILLLRETNS